MLPEVPNDIPGVLLSVQLVTKHNCLISSFNHFVSVSYVVNFEKKRI